MPADVHKAEVRLPCLYCLNDHAVARGNSGDCGLLREGSAFARSMARSNAEPFETRIIEQLIGLREGLDGLASLEDVVFGDGAEPTGGVREVGDPPGIEAHEASAG